MDPGLFQRIQNAFERTPGRIMASDGQSELYLGAGAASYLGGQGAEGFAKTSGGNVKVLLTGIAVSDPALVSQERQGILLKMPEGDASFTRRGGNARLRRKLA
jgi:hypothetical protein